MNAECESHMIQSEFGALNSEIAGIKIELQIKKAERKQILGYASLLLAICALASGISWWFLSKYWIVAPVALASAYIARLLMVSWSIRRINSELISFEGLQNDIKLQTDFGNAPETEESRKQAIGENDTEGCQVEEGL
ncbi:MAG: hypothetical protein IT174_11310 [Acidobacteria bacterium]|nr:hypothetical protein [Acidobacteriota bacterium]